jgi:hypothetical protein
MLATDRLTIPSDELGWVVRVLILAFLNLATIMIMPGCGRDEAAQTVPQIAAPLKQQAYLKASNTGAGDWFGTNIAVDGDTLVVGARFEDSAATGINGNQADNSAPDSGAVYVFTRTDGVWSQEAYVKASNTEAGDEFGSWVAVDGDTLVVGAPLEDSAATGINGNQADNSAPDSGAVYVFTRTDGAWSQQAYLKASNTEAGDWFGATVAVDGDTLVVGARFEDSAATGINGNQADNSAPDSGAVYVFTRTDGVWSQEAYVKASNTEAGDEFGFWVDLAANTLAVGARFEDSAATGINGSQANNSAPDSGAVYVFTRTGGVWSQQAYLKTSNTGAGDRFGSHVAVDSDTLVSGAPGEGSGAVYVFRRTGEVWSQQAYLKGSNTEADDRFGVHVALAGDTVLVSAGGEASAATGINGNQADNSAPNSGAVYVFTRTGGVWSQQAYLKASNTEAGDRFGIVAVDGDTLVVGALEEASAATGINGNQTDNSAPGSGAVYVFQRQ